MVTDDYYYMYYDYGLTGVVTGVKDISMAFAPRIIDKINDHMGHSLENPLNILPNPVNSQTAIQYFVKAKSPVEISLRNLGGQIISTLVDEVKQQGHHKTILNTNALSAGIYFCVLKTKNGIQTRKMIKL